MHDLLPGREKSSSELREAPGDSAIKSVATDTDGFAA